jgi:hypothetical protein
MLFVTYKVTYKVTQNSLSYANTGIEANLKPQKVTEKTSKGHSGNLKRSLRKPQKVTQAIKPQKVTQKNRKRSLRLKITSLANSNSRFFKRIEVRQRYFKILTDFDQMHNISLPFSRLPHLDLLLRHSNYIRKTFLSHSVKMSYLCNPLSYLFVNLLLVHIRILLLFKKKINFMLIKTTKSCIIQQLVVSKGGDYDT